MKRAPWPPGLGPDTPTDRARTIGRACYNALFSPDPRGAADALRDMAARFGEDGWLTAQPDTLDDDGPWTRAQVAEFAHVDPDTVTTWTSRGFAGVRLVRYPHGYEPSEVKAFLRHRDGIRSAPPERTPS